jgi:hypothetical protein
MKGCRTQYLGLALAIACAECLAWTPSTTSGGDQAETQEGAAPLTRLPHFFTGVWYPDDTEGASECERYRALLPVRSGHDGVDIVRVGSLVITPGLIQAVAEYGEGNFYAVDRIEAEGAGAWRVTARLGIDAMPDESSEEEPVVTRISLHGDKLHWEPDGRRGDASLRYFRCDVERTDGAKHP